MGMAIPSKSAKALRQVLVVTSPVSISTWRSAFADFEGIAKSPVPFACVNDFNPILSLGTGCHTSNITLGYRK